MIEGKARDFFFRGPNSIKLLGRHWSPVGAVRGTLIGVHGYSEHSGCYRHFAEALSQQGLHVAMMDLPGHGLSDGERGNIENFQDYLDSLSSFMKEIKAQDLPGPYFLFAHSLGGLVIIRYLQSCPPLLKIERVALSSPLLGLSLHCFFGMGKIFQSATGRSVIRKVTELLPNLKIPGESGVGESVLTHDPDAARRRRADHLIRPVVTTHWTREFLRVVDRAHDEAPLIRIPFGIFQAGEDHVTDASAAESFIRRIGSDEKYFKSYPGFYHEILNELGKDQVIEEMIQWLLGSSTSKPSTMGSI
jgi:lysophospholipase